MITSIVAFSLSTAASAGDYASPRHLVEHLVVVQTINEDGSYSPAGSGTMLRWGDELGVVTADHVVIDDDGNPLGVQVCGSVDGDWVCREPIEVKRRPDLDLAFLTLDEPVAVPARPGKAVSVGDPVTVVGLPERAVTVVRSQVICHNSYADHPDLWLFGYTTFGGSGGGVFDRKGRLVAVVDGFRIDKDQDPGPIAEELDPFGMIIPDRHQHYLVLAQTLSP